MTPVIAAPEEIVIVDVDLEKVPECDACHGAAEFTLRCRNCPGSFLACGKCLRMLHEQVEGTLGVLFGVLGARFVTPCCHVEVASVNGAYRVDPL